MWFYTYVSLQLEAENRLCSYMNMCLYTVHCIWFIAGCMFKTRVVREKKTKAEQPRQGDFLELAFIPNGKYRLDYQATHAPCDWDLSHRAILVEGQTQAVQMRTAHFKKKKKSTSHISSMWQTHEKRALCAEPPGRVFIFSTEGQWTAPHWRDAEAGRSDPHPEAHDAGSMAADRGDHGNKGNNNLSPLFSRAHAHARTSHATASVLHPSPNAATAAAFQMRSRRRPSSRSVSLQPTAEAESGWGSGDRSSYRGDQASPYPAWARR